MASRPLSAAAIALLAACTDPTFACDLCTTSAVVYGSVTTSGGETVGGATVRAYAGADPCDVHPATAEIARAVTDGLGRYRMQLRSPYAAPQCLQVEASGLGAEPARTNVPPVRLKPTGSLPYDSVRADIRAP